MEIKYSVAVQLMIEVINDPLSLGNSDFTDFIFQSCFQQKKTEPGVALESLLGGGA